MKRILTILAATLLLTAAMAGTASASSYDSVAEELSAIGVFRGTAGGFELDRAPTRSEAAIMLVRLYGAEDEAKAAYEAGEISMPFTDVSETAAPSVASWSGSFRIIWMRPFPETATDMVSWMVSVPSEPSTAMSIPIFMV